MLHDVQDITVGEGAAARQLAVLARSGHAPASCGSAGSCRTCAPPRPRSSTAGRRRPGAPSSASTIRATDNRADVRGQHDFPLARGRVGRSGSMCPRARPRRILHGRMDSLLATRELLKTAPERAPAGIVLIAPAVDFTERLMWDRFPEAIKRTIEEAGVFHRPSPYSDTPYPITRALIEDGRRPFCSESRSQRAARCTSSKE